MNSNLKHKNILLIIGFVTALCLIYPLAIKKTLDYKRKKNILQQEYLTYNNAQQQLKKLQQKNTYLDKILSKNKLSIDLSFQQVLLRKINDFIEYTNETLDLIAFEQPHVQKMQNGSAKTYKFSVKGNFIATLKFINYLEKQRLGSILSVNFEKTKNYKTRKEYLTTTVYLQKISD